MNLKEMRKKQGLSQQDMAKIIGADQKTYSNYENGKTDPTLKTVLKLSDYFGCTLDELVGNKKKTSPTTSPTKQRALDIFNQLADNDYLVLIGYMEHLLLEKEQKRKQRVNALIDNINRGE